MKDTRVHIRPFASLRNGIKAFWRDSSGNVTIEFVLVMPILFWAFMATYVFFDGYRQSTVNLKAAYAIGDLISRETDAVNDAYVDSMYELYKLMVRARTETKMRITIVRFDQQDDRYYVDWSKERGYGTVRDNESIKGITSELPVMPDNERVILIETRNKFVPLFNVGMKNKQLKNMIFTRPRFAPQVVWEDT